MKYSFDAIPVLGHHGACTVQGSPRGPDLNCSYAMIEFKADGTIDPAALSDLKKQLPGCF